MICGLIGRLLIPDAALRGIGRVQWTAAESEVAFKWAVARRADEIRRDIVATWFPSILGRDPRIR